MHPQEFVASMVATGRIEELVQMLNGFIAKLRGSKTSEHATVYFFATAFLISVQGQLRLLEPGKILDDDRVLSVWKELGLFGIDRDEIQGILSTSLDK
jgi:hypothetical protein